MVTEQQLLSWLKNGYLHIRSFYSLEEIARIRDWTDELKNLPEEKGKWMLYYEESLADKSKMVCRIENFLPYHPGFDGLLSDNDLLETIGQLIGERPSLFKEKINFKLAGGNGFSPHQDAPAFSLFDQPYHVTVMICIDPCTKENGCLEVAAGRHMEGLLAQEPNGDISKTLVNELIWEQLPAIEGDVIIFDSFIPHRSGPNRADKPRSAVFATYNRLSDGNRRNDYFDAKRLYFPPENERDPLKNYSLNNPFNLGNPIK